MADGNSTKEEYKQEINIVGTSMIASIMAIPVKPPNKICCVSQFMNVIVIFNKEFDCGLWC